MEVNTPELRAFTRAHLALDSETRQHNAAIRPSREATGRLKKQILSHLIETNREYHRINEDTIFRVKYNTSTRAVTYEHISQVVYGVGREELLSISSVAELIGLIADRMHRLRVKRNPTFDVLTQAPTHTNQQVHPASPEVIELAAPFIQQTKILNAKQNDFKSRKRQLANLIEDATPAIATIMASRAPLAAGASSADSRSACSSAQPVRVDVRNHGTFFVRAKPKMKSYRAPTLKTLKEVGADTFSELGLSDANFKTQFLNLQQAFIDEFSKHLKNARCDTQDGVRFCLDKTTKARH